MKAKDDGKKQRLNPLQVDKAYLQPIRFQGQSFDSETGLHYNHFRYYDPDMGMFISRDPIGLMGGDNVFAYAPNPTGWIDPLGLAMGSGADSVEASIPPAIPIESEAVLIGYGDGLTFGLTKYGRELLGLSEPDCTSCSKLYSQGELLGMGVSTVVTGVNSYSLPPNFITLPVLKDMQQYFNRE